MTRPPLVFYRNKPFKILEIHNGNKPHQEYVRIEVTEDTNTAGYALVDKTFNKDGGLSNEFRHIFIFPSLSVVQGDIILLYTGPKLKNDPDFEVVNRVRYHYLYWNSDTCIWNDKEGDEAFMFRYIPVSRRKTAAK